MSTREELFHTMYPGLSDGEVIDELIKAGIHGFEHGPEVLIISAADGIHSVPYDAAVQRTYPYFEVIFPTRISRFVTSQSRFSRSMESGFWKIPHFSAGKTTTIF